jgi:hypothetical protein
MDNFKLDGISTVFDFTWNNHLEKLGQAYNVGVI